MNARLHILLPVHNRKETTVRFVEALGRQTWRDFHLVVIDDGSTDGTEEAVRASCPSVTVLRGDGNLWWAGSLALGGLHLRRSGAREEDFVLIINDDVEIGPDFLARGLDELSGRPGTLLLARQTDSESGEDVGLGGGVNADMGRLRFRATNVESEINCLPTRGLFLRWADWLQAGGFDPRRLPHYLSDYEFTLRAKRRGLRLLVAREATLGVRLAMSGHSSLDLTRHHADFGERVRLLFSLRNKDNPVVWSRFVALTAAPARRPFLWAKIWWYFLRSFFRLVREAVSARSHARKVGRDK